MTNREYIVAFLEEFSYPEEAREVLLAAFDSICEVPARKDAFDELLSRYASDKALGFMKLLDDIHKLSEEAGVHEYVGTLVLFICMTDQMWKYYQEAGHTRKMWFTMVSDLKYKLIECKSVYNIWGCFAQTWYSGIFALRRFAFCKLQFDLGTFGADYEKDGVVLTPESKAVNVHIPQTGTKLDVESKNESYRQAAEFYREAFGGGPVIFTCRSWLLFPRHREVMNPLSNMIAFMNDFDEVESGLYDDYSQAWRLFGVNYEGDPAVLPRDTSLRRTYAEWIENGEPTGWAKGVIVYK